MDSNFIHMTAAASYADEEQGSGASRGNAGFVALSTRSPLKEQQLGNTTYHGSEDDYSSFKHQMLASEKEDGFKHRRARFLEQLHAFRIMSAPYFRESREGRCLFAIMVVLSLMNSAVRVAFSYLSRDFWSALSDKDQEQLYVICTFYYVWYYVFVFYSSCAVNHSCHVLTSCQKKTATT